MKEEFGLLGAFIRRKGLRYTGQRNKILAAFLSTEHHVSVEELHKLLKKSDKAIGYTTVYRTMKLFLESGLAQEVEFGDGVPRYEHKYGHQHHDHLICIKCGRYLEVMNSRIEKMQDALARESGFNPLSHTLRIFGICKNCKGSSYGSDQ